MGEAGEAGEEGRPESGPSLRISVEEIVLRAACLARSVLTKLLTKSSRFPLRPGEASSSSGAAESLSRVTELPRAGDSRVEEVGEETEEDSLERRWCGLRSSWPGWTGWTGRSCRLMQSGGSWTRSQRCTELWI